MAGGLARALDYGDRVGAEVVQVFVSNPRGWAPAAGSARQDAAFRDGCGQRGWPVFVHAPYLVNLASPTLATKTRSVDALAHSLRRAGDIGATGVVVHAGSAVAGARYEQALGQLRELLLPLLDKIDDAGPRLLVEPTAGGGMTLAARVEQLEQYFAALDGHPKLGVCLDTCHAWAAGHDLAAARGLARTVTALTKAVGRGRLGLVHANDSRDPCGSLRDRHQTLGAGTIGAAAFGQLFGVRALAGVPIVVETPGETHSADIALLKRFRDPAAEPAVPSAEPGALSVQPGAPSVQPGVPPAEPPAPSAEPAALSVQAGVPSAEPAALSVQAGVPSAEPAVPSARTGG